MPSDPRTKAFAPAFTVADSEQGLSCPQLRGLFAEMSAEPLPDKLRDLTDALEAAFQRRRR